MAKSGYVQLNNNNAYTETDINSDSPHIINIHEEVPVPPLNLNALAQHTPSKPRLLPPPLSLFSRATEQNNNTNDSVIININSDPVESKEGKQPLLPQQKTEELSDEDKETLAFYIYQSTQDKIKSLEGKERFIFGAVVIFALIGSINCKDFGDKFVRGLKELSKNFNASSETTQAIVMWGITASYLIAQFSLSANSLLTVLTRFVRYCISPITPSEGYANSLSKLLSKFKNVVTRKDFILDKASKPRSKKEKFFLALVPFSMFPSGRFSYEAMQEYGASERVARIGNCRSISSLAINVNFTDNYNVKKRSDADFDDAFPIIRLYRDAAKKLKKLAANRNPGDARKFIKILNDGLLKNLSDAPDEKKEEATKFQQQLQEEVIAKLLDFTPNAKPSKKPAEAEKSTCPSTSEMAGYVSLLISILVSLTNFKGGTIVPKEFGATLPKDLWEFFATIKDQETMVIVATLIGAIFFGLPSWFVNIIINVTSFKDMLDSVGNLIKGVKEKGPIEYFKQYSKRDVADICVSLTFGLGYGFGNGGAGYKYPPLNISPIPLINMVLSTLNFFALGYVSIAKLIKTVRASGEDNTLLQGALEAVKNTAPGDHLETYFNNLPDTTIQGKLVTLLWEFVEKVLNIHIETYKRLKPQYVKALMSENLQEKIEARVALKEIIIDSMNNTMPAATQNNAIEMQQISSPDTRNIPTRGPSDSPELRSLTIHDDNEYKRLESANGSPTDDQPWIPPLPTNLNYHQPLVMFRPITPAQDRAPIHSWPTSRPHSSNG